MRSHTCEALCRPSRKTDGLGVLDQGPSRGWRGWGTARVTVRRQWDPVKIHSCGQGEREPGEGLEFGAGCGMDRMGGFLEAAFPSAKVT